MRSMEVSVLFHVYYLTGYTVPNPYSVEWGKQDFEVKVKYIYRIGGDENHGMNET
jgi:hypothetical protein